MKLTTDAALHVAGAALICVLAASLLYGIAVVGPSRLQLAALGAAVVDTEALDRVLSWSDVVVIATGAERVAERLRAGQRAVAYRHIPDPADVDRLAESLVPDERPVQAAAIRRSSQ